MITTKLRHWKATETAVEESRPPMNRDDVRETFVHTRDSARSHCLRLSPAPELMSVRHLIRVLEVLESRRQEPDQRPASAQVVDPTDQTEPVEPASQEVGSQVPAPRKENFQNDRRVFPRREGSCQVSVCRLNEASPGATQAIAWSLHSNALRGPIVDVSLNGIAFELDTPLNVDEALHLQLTNRSFDSRLELRARVLRCSQIGDRRWKIVGRFANNLTLEQVQLFGRTPAVGNLI